MNRQPHPGVWAVSGPAAYPRALDPLWTAAGLDPAFIYAYEKTGRIVWSFGTKARVESSPVASVVAVRSPAAPVSVRVTPSSAGRSARARARMKASKSSPSPAPPSLHRR